MRPFRIAAAIMCSVLLSAGAAWAQSYEESVEESNREFTESMAALSEFVKDVHFNEKDVNSVLANLRDFIAVGEDLDDGAVVEGDDGGETINFQELIAYPAYRSWAKSRGLDPETWLKKFMRIQVMLMKEAGAGGMDGGADEIRRQLAELEGQRAQMGEEVYQQMKAAMEAGAATMNVVQKAYSNMPDPTAAEKKLLEKYGEQLMDMSME